MRVDFYFLLHIFDLCEAFGADTLAVEVYHVVGVTAEDAGGSVFLKDYSVAVGEDLYRILGAQVEGATDLLGENYSAQLVDGTYHSC